MKRATCVAILAALIAAIFGVDDPSWAGLARAAEQEDQHRREVAAMLQAIPIGSPIEIQPVRGKKIQGLLEEVLADQVVIKLVSGNYSVSRTIPIDDVRSLKRISKLPKGGGLSRAKKVAIGVGIGVGVAIGVCAASARFEDRPGEKTGPAAELAH